MGMYDNLYINTDKLPVTDEEKKILGENPNWQTKDFDCKLTEVYITDGGELKINKWEGFFERTNERMETIQFHGFVNFYANVGELWFEFFAKFTDGKLVSIEGGLEK